MTATYNPTRLQDLDDVEAPVDGKVPVWDEGADHLEWPDTFSGALISVGTITSSQIADGTVQVGDLAFDPATQAELNTAISTEVFDRNAAITSAVASHEADTTNVHGIADTSALVLTSDSRLSNARTPTAHAATHLGGSDSLYGTLDARYFLVSASVALAANMGISAAAGTGSLDMSAASGVFKTSTGNVTLGGDVAVSSGKSFTVNGGVVTHLTDTTFTLAGGAPSPKYSVAAGSQAIKSDQYGNVWFGKNLLATEALPSSEHAMLPDFFWSANIMRLITRNLTLGEMDDPADLTFRRFGPEGGYPYAKGPLLDGTASDLTGLDANVAIGQVRWIPASAPVGGGSTTPGGTASALCATITVKTAEVPKRISNSPERYAVGATYNFELAPIGHDVSLLPLVIQQSGHVEVQQTLRFGPTTVSSASGTDGVTNGTTTFVSATGGFVAADVGKGIVVGNPLGSPAATYARITGYTNATTVTLNTTITSGTGLTWRIDYAPGEMWLDAGSGGAWNNGQIASNAILASLRGFSVSRATTDTAYAAVRTATNLVLANDLVSGDANHTFQVRGDGRIQWGAGGGTALDVGLWRGNTSTLYTDGSLRMTSASAGITIDGLSASNTPWLTIKVSGDTGSRLVARPDRLEWGGGAGATDVTLQYTAAGTMTLTATQVTLPAIIVAAAKTLTVTSGASTLTGPASGTALTINTGAAANVGLYLGAAASQTAALTEWRDSASALLSSVGPAGRFGIRAAVSSTTSLTVSPVAVTDVGIIVTGVASQSGDLQRWTNSTPTTLAKIDSAGGLTAASLTTAGNIVQTGATTVSTGTGALSLNGDTTLASGKNLQISNTGRILFRNAADSAYLRMFDIDTGNNLNIGRDTSIGNLQVFNNVEFYNDSTQNYLRVREITNGGAIEFGKGGSGLGLDVNIYRSGASSLATDNDFKLAVVGKGLYIKEGSNATMGTATLVLGTATVSTTKVTASSRIFLSIESLGTVALPKTVGVTARTAGTSFTITSSDVTDTSVVAWIILEPA